MTWLRRNELGHRRNREDTVAFPGVGPVNSQNVSYILSSIHRFKVIQLDFEDLL